MQRRHFFNTALASALLPQFTFAGNLTRHSINTPTPDYLFFDERFCQAGQSVFSRKKIAVRSDITPLWNAELKAVIRDTSLVLEGLTTESFYFCLHRMLQSQCPVDAAITRIDQNLYAWSIITSSLNDNRKIT